MKFSEKRPVGDIVKSGWRNASPGVLDEHLNHLDTRHKGIGIVHQIDVVLPAFRQILLSHQPYGVSPVDDEEFTLWRLVAIYGEIRTHNDSPNDAPVLILDGIHLGSFGKCKKIALDRRIVNK